MTGYGRGTQTFGNKTITVEVRSLNSKFTDLRLKAPQNYRAKETELRRKVIERAQRGKLDLSVDVKSLQGDDEYGLNKALFKRYYKEISALAVELGMPQGDITQAILRLPNVVGSEEGSLDDKEWTAILKALDGALDKFEQFRLSEGEAMETDLKSRITNILETLAQIDPFEKERIGRLRQRLYQNLEDYLGKDKVDENRFEQEIIFYLEKIDITEEKVRLEQHCNYFLEVMEKKNTLKGRKLSFISQEMGREINTLGAKAYSSDIQRYVVSMKDELEKIKELVVNCV
ncbi:MAG: hypothetical protein DHS20C18_07580 [Saprospiraceae bacterium]|nr:MAG: hypothetical protein DHS20C18_07580 [Saprospiraceae bacterium]